MAAEGWVPLMKMNPSPLQTNHGLHAGAVWGGAPCGKLALPDEAGKNTVGQARQNMTEKIKAAQAHPLAELLACPPETGKALSEAAMPLNCSAGEVVFAQTSLCRGLYLVVSGIFQRRAERLERSLNLGQVHAGELLELASVLGEVEHTFTLVAQSPGLLLLLPIDALRRAFVSYPPLRMHLLEELAREVSRAYGQSAMHGLRRHRHASE